MRSRSIAVKNRSTGVAVATSGQPAPERWRGRQQWRLLFERLHGLHEHIKSRARLSATESPSAPYRRKQWLRTALCIVTARLDARKQGHPIRPATPNESAPTTGALPNFNRQTLTRRSWPPCPQGAFLAVVMGIARGFIASGTTRKRSTCRSPFSRLAPLIWTWSASWKLRSKFRSAMPW